MTPHQNTIQRGGYRERRQPHHREKKGLLEKHKDYHQRAKDYSTKKKHLSNLRQKAAHRNPDEFYFGMHSSKSNYSRSSRNLKHSTLRHLKIQDQSYLAKMMQKTRRLRQETEKAAIMSRSLGRKVSYLLKDMQKPYKAPDSFLLKSARTVGDLSCPSQHQSPLENSQIIQTHEDTVAQEYQGISIGQNCFPEVEKSISRRRLELRYKGLCDMEGRLMKSQDGLRAFSTQMRNGANGKLSTKPLLKVRERRR